jgi:hypothetical protein
VASGEEIGPSPRRSRAVPLSRGGRPVFTGRHYRFAALAILSRIPDNIEAIHQCHTAYSCDQWTNFNRQPASSLTFGIVI